MLQPGDMALTDYNGPGPMTKVEILERDDKRLHGHSQSGVMFRVRPILRNGTNASWYDADWFEPVPANALGEGRERGILREASSGEAATSTAGLGAAVIVGGVVVAWFAEWTEEAREWCTENHFGQWLTWRAKAPEIVPLTEAEYAEAMRRGKELAALFEDMPEAPNA